MDHSLDPHLILPVGTQVVALVEARGTDGKPVHPRGAVGVVIQSPADYWHSYRVRFPDDFECSFRRQELAILAQYKQGDMHPEHPLKEYNLYDCVIYRCIVGSRAYGLEGMDSDTDRRGVYLPPAGLHWSLYGVPEQLEKPDTEECYWELQKFLTLALKANPNVLECLYTPLVEHATPLARQMLAIRQSFLSKMVYQTYNGYVMSQFKKLQADLRNKGQVKWKHVMHLIRLLLSGITVLKEAFVPVRVEEHREKLLAIKRGEVPWNEVEGWRLALHREFDQAFKKTTLPERPDYERANTLLVEARQSAVAAPPSDGSQIIQEQPTTMLYRPVGQMELELIRKSGWRRFPPRLPSQPIFYPVLTEDYAIRIARDWNTKDPNSGHIGYVTRFAVRKSFLDRHEVHPAGGRDLLEYWIPAEALDAFNDSIVGPIEIIHEFRPASPPPTEPPSIEMRLQAVVQAQPFPLLFATISGAHLYGFPSPDSDYDLRGVHVLPVRDVVGLNPGQETIEISRKEDGLELDLVTHDAKKFFGLMLKKNGYVLEQLYSPLIVHTTREHEELKAIGRDCITRHHAHHYFGFAETQWKLFEKERPRRVKPLLYVYRVLLTGIHLMRTGIVEANLLRLNESFRLSYIDELVKRKLAGPEKSRLPDADMAFHEAEYARLRSDLQTAFEASTLPEAPSAQRALSDLLIRLRTTP